VTVACTHSACRDLPAWCAWRNAGSGAARTGLRRWRGRAACLEKEATGRDCLADTQTGLEPMAVGPPMEGCAGLYQRRLLHGTVLRAFAAHGCETEDQIHESHVTGPEALERQTSGFRRYRLSHMANLVNMQPARCDTGAHGAAHGLLPARSQRAAWPCAHRIEAPANVATCRRRLQPIQAVLTVGSATSNMFYRLQRQAQYAYVTQHDAVAQAERPAATLSEIQKWGDDRRLQTQVCSVSCPSPHVVPGRRSAQRYMVSIQAPKLLSAEDVAACAEWQVVTDIADDTIGIRSLDWDRDRFDIEFGCAARCTLLTMAPHLITTAVSTVSWRPHESAVRQKLVFCWLGMHSAGIKSSTAGCRLQNGTTYNSYLIFGEDKTALVDVSHEKFRSLYMKTLQEQLAKAGRTVDYVIVSHTEPDHSGAGCCCLKIPLSLRGSPKVY